MGAPIVGLILLLASAPAAAELFPWQSCDDAALWGLSPLWGPGEPRCSLDAANVREGSAAVRVDFRLSAAGSYSVGLSPRFTPPLDISAFTGFSLDVYNPDPWPKRIRVTMRSGAGRQYRFRHEAVGREEDYSTAPASQVPAGPGWATVRFRFDYLQGPEELTPATNASLLRDVERMVLAVSDDPPAPRVEREGYFLVDHWVFLTEPYTLAEAARYPVRLAPGDPEYPEFERLLANVRARFARGRSSANLDDLNRMLELAPANDTALVYLRHLYRQAPEETRQRILAHYRRQAGTEGPSAPQPPKPGGAEDLPAPQPPKPGGLPHPPGLEAGERAAAFRRIVGALERASEDALPRFVAESAREIPVLARVDVVVAGGSSAAVAAAQAAAKAGARVFLVAEEPYLGHDLAGTLHLWPEAGAAPPEGLARDLFAKPTPLHVKTVLDQALLSSGAGFLYSCYATDLLVDRHGRPAGIAIANRSGRQAILAKVVVDATATAHLAREAGAGFHPFVAGARDARWVSIAERDPLAEGLPAEKLPFPVDVYDKRGVQRDAKRSAAWYDHTLTVDLLDASWPERARAEQAIRDRAYTESQLWSSEVPLLPGPARIRGTLSSELGAFRPEGAGRVWVIGDAADLSAPTGPVVLLGAGARVGAAAAREAAALADPEGVRVAAGPGRANTPGEVRENLAGMRPSQAAAHVPQARRPLPVLGQYDVVVVGGGTSGAPAGIGAARRGARVLVLEYLHGLGGVGTLGMIGGYWYGNRVGFTRTVPAFPTERRMEWYRRELRRAGADIWFGVAGCGVVMLGNRVTGVVVATPYGRGVVLAGAVVDATGNAEIAAAAGAPTAYVDDDLTLQAAHLPPRQVGAYYVNGDLPAVDVSDPINAREVLLGKSKMTGRFDVGSLIDARERQRVVGDTVLDWLDVINQRTFPDSIVLSRSDYDSHGGQVHPFFCLRPSRPPDSYSHQFQTYTPYRCLLPKGVEGLLVTGLGTSAHRDALPIIRMQPDLHNQGYAAGVAAAMAVQAGITPRQVDVKALQRHLVEIGNLPESVLTDGDSFPLPPERVAQAVESVPDGFQGLEVVMAHPDAALPRLRAALASAAGEEALVYAEVLGVMGDGAGVPLLVAEAERRLAARDLLIGEKEYPDAVERLIWALGLSGDRRALPVLLSLARAVGKRDPYKFRALVGSFGRIADPAAAEVIPLIADLDAKEPGRRELLAACALYRCGDPNGAARAILERLVESPNGPLSRLSRQVLASPPGTPAKR